MAPIFAHLAGDQASRSDRDHCHAQPPDVSGSSSAAEEYSEEVRLHFGVVRYPVIDGQSDSALVHFV